MSIILASESPFVACQGEGPTQGYNAIFLRYVGCNAKCVDCDSKFAWKAGQVESKKWTNKELFAEIRKYKTSRIIFSGGECLCLPNNFKHSKEVINEFPDYHFEYETNGIVSKSHINSIISFFERINSLLHINISPKFNFAQEEEIDTTPNLISILQNLDFYNFIVKFLFKDENDIKLIEQFQKDWNLSNNQMWLQPIGTNAEILKQTILNQYDKIIENGWNISMRSHVFLFGNKKGV
jgi:7-carboxy-7-deazaguanine synthase